MLQGTGSGSSWPPTSTILSWAQTSRRARKAPTMPQKRTSVCPLSPTKIFFSFSDPAQIFHQMSLVLSSLSLLSPFSPLSPLLSLSSRDPNPTCCVLAAQLKPTRFLWLKFAATLKQFYQDKCLSQLSWKSLKIFVWRCAESDLRASRASKSREATNASKSIKRRKRSLLCGVDVCV